MSRRNGVLVVQLNAVAGSKATEKGVGFQEADATSDVRELRERCKTKVKT